MKKTLMIALLLSLTACGVPDQVQASRGGTVEVGSLPVDMCHQMGKPLIVSVSVENEGDIDLAYFNTKGELVVQKYGVGFGGFTTKPQGKLFWDADGTVRCDQR